MYGNAVFGRAFNQYKTMKHGSPRSPIKQVLGMCGFLDGDGVVKCSVGLAFFLNYLSLV